MRDARHTRFGSLQSPAAGPTLFVTGGALVALMFVLLAIDYPAVAAGVVAGAVSATGVRWAYAHLSTPAPRLRTRSAPSGTGVSAPHTRLAASDVYPTGVALPRPSSRPGERDRRRSRNTRGLN